MENSSVPESEDTLLPGVLDGQASTNAVDFTECVCCFEQAATIVFSKCGHLAYCKTCRTKALKRELGSQWTTISSFARRLRKPLRCPLCRTESQAVEMSKFSGVVFS